MTDQEEEHKRALDEENEGYDLASRGLSKAKRSVMTMISGYTEDDVQALDVQTGNFQTMLSRIRRKYDEVNDSVDSVIDDIENGVATKEVKDERIKVLEDLKKNLMEAIKDNEKKVKEKAMTFVAGGVTPKEKGTAPTKDKDEEDEGHGLDVSREESSKQGKTAKFKIVLKQVKAKSIELRKAATAHAKPDLLKQGEVGEKLLESKDWIRKVEELQKTVDVLEQDGAVLGLSLEAADEAFEESKAIVMKQIEDLKIIDKKKGFNSLSTRVKESCVYPAAFKGTFGSNVYKWVKEMEDALEGSQLREEDKTKKVLQYLEGEAKVKIGIHHKDVKSIFKTLEEFFGNPRAIWTKCRKDLEDEVGKDFRKQWGNYGSNQRVLAIARVIEFIRQAEVLGIEFPDALGAEVFSSNTLHLLKCVMPREYIEKVNDAVCSINISDKDKIMKIKDFLEEKRRSAVMGAEGEGDQVPFNRRQQGAGNGANFQNQGEGAPPRHKCKPGTACRLEWDLLGCAEIYKIESAHERSRIILWRGCMRCGAPFKKGPDGLPHKCSWAGTKYLARCQGIRCNFAAATCGDHESESNCTKDLLDWAKSAGIITNIFTMNQEEFKLEDVKKKPLEVIDEEVAGDVICSRARPITDEEIVKERENVLKLVREARRHGIAEKDIVPVPKGKGTFEFCVIAGKTGPLNGFIDSGADGFFASDEAIKDMVAVKITEGPIPIHGMGGRTVHASGEWAAVLPLSNGTYQAVQVLTLGIVARDWPEIDLRGLLEKIKQRYPWNEELQELKVPEKLGGKIDLIMGQRYRRIYPDKVIKLPSGLEVGRSKLAPWKEGEVATISGPLQALSEFLNEFELNSALSEVRSLTAVAAKLELDVDIEPKITPELVDFDIPGVDELCQEGLLMETLQPSMEGNSEASVNSVQGDIKSFTRIQVTHHGG